MSNWIASRRALEGAYPWGVAVICGLTLLAGGRALAESGFDPTQTDRHDNYNKAKDTANNGNQQNLQPDMMSHLMQAAQHMQQAEQARQQQNFPQANQEQQLAQIEQAKAQQLQQQIQANNKSAQDNQDGANQTKDQDSTGKQIGQAKQNPDAGRPVRENAGYNRASTTVADTMDTSSSDGSGGSAGSGLPSDQLANLGAAQFTVASRPPDGVRPPPGVPADAAPSIQPDLSLVTLSTPKNGDPGTAGTAPIGGPPSAPAVAGATTVSPALDGLSDLNSRLIAAASPTDKADAKEADFWKQARDSVADSSDSAAGDGKSALRGQPAKDDTPGRKLSDEAFWKKVGNEPKECKASSKTATAQRARARRLKEARKKIERRWRTQRKSSALASNVKSLRK